MKLRYRMLRYDMCMDQSTSIPLVRHMKSWQLVVDFSSFGCSLHTSKSTSVRKTVYWNRPNYIKVTGTCDRASVLRRLFAQYTCLFGSQMWLRQVIEVLLATPKQIQTKSHGSGVHSMICNGCGASLTAKCGETYKMFL
jgi:hypothetical protein